MKKAPSHPSRSRGPARPVAAERETGITAVQAAGIYFLLAAVFLLPAFVPGQQIYGTDYIGGGYFFYHFISERLGDGALPKWVPYVFGGMPLFANPGSTFQPAHFLGDLVLPTSRVLAFVFLVHFWVAGVGMYLLARELGCRGWVAFVAGLAFQFTGITTSWVYAGHDGRIIVATLAPLFFYFIHRGVRTERVSPFAGAAATLGAALLSFQIQNSYYMLLGAALWGVFCLVHHRQGRTPVRLARSAALGVAAVAFGFVLTAVNFLPFLGYVSESPRGMEGGRGYEYATSFSMPPAEILSLAVPEHHGASVRDPSTGEALFPSYRGANPFKLHTEYVGAFVVVLLALGFAYARRDRYWWFFGGLALFMLSIALGGNTPLYRLYFEVLPGTQRFRAPSLAFFVVALSLVVMAALALEHVARLRAAARERPAGRGGENPELARLHWIVAVVIGAGVLGLLATTGESAAARGGLSPSIGWTRFLLFAALVGGAIWAWVSSRLTTTVFALALALVTGVDLWMMGRRFVHTVDPPEAIFAADDVIRFLEAQPEPGRVWTFPFPEHYRGAGAYGGNFPMLFGVEQVGGEHPNMLQRWVEYVGAGTQTYIDWNNLITRAEIVETAEGQAIGFEARPGFLEAANVRYVVSMAPLAHPALREVHRGSALIYEHTGALPRAYLVGEARAVGPGQSMLAAMQAEAWDPRSVAFVAEAATQALAGGAVVGETRILVQEPDRVVVHVTSDRPALLVLADNFYDGWEAEVNGSPAEVVPANHTFRGVVVPEGDSTVEFVFRPAALYTGLYITIGGFLLLLGFGAVVGTREWRGRAAPPAAE